MKSQFILFGGVEHYAGGGFNDFLSCHAGLDDAIKAAADARVVPDPDDADYNYPIEWWHVFDCELSRVVARSYYQAHAGAEPDEPIRLSSDKCFIADRPK